jgi:hypothetical protein
VVTVIPGGRARQRPVDLLDVAQVQVLGVVAALGDHRPLRRVVEVGKAGVVELEVGAAQLADAPDLLGVGVAQVAPELLQVGVDVAVDRRLAAAIVDHVRRWDGELGGGRGHHRLQRLEVLAEDGLLQADLAFDLERRRGELDGAGWVAELDLQVLRCSRDTAEPVDEVHVPGGAAELAVGGRLQTDVLLHRDHIADRVVLDHAQLLVGDASGGVVVARLQQPPRAQQASDVVRPERWCGPAHGTSSDGCKRHEPVVKASLVTAPRSELTSL